MICRVIASGLHGIRAGESVPRVALDRHGAAVAGGAEPGVRPMHVAQLPAAFRLMPIAVYAEYSCCLLPGPPVLGISRDYLSSNVAR